MNATPHLARVIEEAHAALDAFARGDPEPYKVLYSRTDEVTLANPFGPPVRGWADVEAAMTHAATHYRDGRAVGFDPISQLVTPSLAYTVEMEHWEAKIGGRNDVTPVTLRVTTIFRPEGGTWKVVHRHADPIAGSRPAESVIQG